MKKRQMTIWMGTIQMVICFFYIIKAYAVICPGMLAVTLAVMLAEI